MRNSLLTFLILLACIFSNEQACAKISLAKNDSLQPGLIEFRTAAAIDSLEKRSRGKLEIKGYRVQIFLGSYNDAKNSRAKFLNLGIPIQAYINQNTPDYVVRVGDFRNLLEANKYFSEIKQQYPSAFIVADKIEPSRLTKRAE